MTAAAIPPIRKSVHVRAPVPRAFDVFTAGLTRWWPTNAVVSRKLVERVLMETRLGGRWLEIAADGSETVVATIMTWDPPRRLVLLWHANGEGGRDRSMQSEVEIRFMSDGGEGTHVELLHHKFETLGTDVGPMLRQRAEEGWPRMLAFFVAAADATSS